MLERPYQAWPHVDALVEDALLGPQRSKAVPAEGDATEMQRLVASDALLAHAPLKGKTHSVRPFAFDAGWHPRPEYDGYTSPMGAALTPDGARWIVEYLAEYIQHFGGFHRFDQYGDGRVGMGGLLLGSWHFFGHKVYYDQLAQSMPAVAEFGDAARWESEGAANLSAEQLFWRALARLCVMLRNSFAPPAGEAMQWWDRTVTGVTQHPCVAGVFSVGGLLSEEISVLGWLRRRLRLGTRVRNEASADVRERLLLRGHLVAMQSDEDVNVVSQEDGALRVLTRVRHPPLPRAVMTLGYKAVWNAEMNGYCVVVLAIPRGARTNISLPSRDKFRTAECVPLVIASIVQRDAATWAVVADDVRRTARSLYRNTFVYEEGRAIRIPDFSGERSVCGAGVHFFVNPHHVGRYAFQNQAQLRRLENVEALNGLVAAALARHFGAGAVGEAAAAAGARAKKDN